MPRRKRRKFSAEEKADAVRMVREVGNLAKVARDLDERTGSRFKHTSDREPGAPPPEPTDA